MGPQKRRWMTGWDLHVGVVAVGGPALVLVVRPGSVERVDMVEGTRSGVPGQTPHGLSIWAYRPSPTS